jgi:phosphosulfolactate synthase (CoM biosynthesis protein A)
MRDKWSDERMDDLNRRVENGFNRVDADLREIRAEIGALRAETNARFDSLQRTMLQLGGGMFATFAIGFAGLIATRL